VRVVDRAVVLTAGPSRLRSVPHNRRIGIGAADLPIVDRHIRIRGDFLVVRQPKGSDFLILHLRQTARAGAGNGRFRGARFSCRWTAVLTVT
jgi:hypothetical protein